ncbi:hypothetical protein MRX96_047450 [Rhipicephalus microplus]
MHKRSAQARTLTDLGSLGVVRHGSLRSAVSPQRIEQLVEHALGNLAASSFHVRQAQKPELGLQPVLGVLKRPVSDHRATGAPSDHVPRAGGTAVPAHGRKKTS